MRVVVQRVSRAKVKVDLKTIGAIASGLVLLVGFTEGDTIATVEKMADKILSLRLFSDEEGKMNFALNPLTQKMLVISQFTLYGNIKKGRRPSFEQALKSAEASELYAFFCQYCRNKNYIIEQGIFGSQMEVSLINDGPVTLMIDSESL